MPGRRPDALVAILAATAGATEAISFLALGGVFSSVMTANLVLLGLDAGQQNGALTLRAGAALTGYIVGALAASRLTRPAAEPGKGWPAPVCTALVAEGIVFAGSRWAGKSWAANPPGRCRWPCSPPAPPPWAARALPAALTESRKSSSCMTGMLTGLVADLAAPGGKPVARRLRLLAMLIAGAIASGVTYTQVPRLAPLNSLALLAGVIGIAAGTRTGKSRRAGRCRSQ